MTKKDFLPLWIFTTLFQTGGALSYTVFAPLGEKVLPIWLVGVLIGVASLIQLVLDIPAGIALDRYGYVRFLRITTSIFFVAVLVLLLPFQGWTYLLMLALTSFGWLFFDPGVQAYMLSSSPQAFAGKYMGITDMAKSLGTVFAVILFTFVLGLVPFAMGIVFASIFFAAFLALLFVKKEKSRDAAAEKKIPSHHYRVRRKPLGHLFRTLKRLNPVSTTLLLLGFASATFYAVIWFVIPLTIVHQVYGISEAWGLAVFDFAVVVLGGVLGKLADTYRKKLLVLLGLILFAVLGALLGFSPGIWFIVIGFLATSGEELAGVALWAWLNNLDKEHAEDGFIAGIMTFASDLGWAVGPALAGLLYGRIGPALAIAIGAVPLFLTLVVYIVIAFHIPFVGVGQNSSASLGKPHFAKHKH